MEHSVLMDSMGSRISSICRSQDPEDLGGAVLILKITTLGLVMVPGGGENTYDNNAYYSSGPLAYGNPQILPLIGGSGGKAGGSNGGAGGGAILIAVSGTISIGGSLHANGQCSGGGYCGSGGAIRLVANQVLGSGAIDASYARLGRIRIEANTTSSALNVNPVVIAVPPNPLVIWPATNAPTVQVVSVGSLTAPADPLARMSVSGNDDLILASTNTVAIVL